VRLDWALVLLLDSRRLLAYLPSRLHQIPLGRVAPRPTVQLLHYDLLLQLEVVRILLLTGNSLALWGEWSHNKIVAATIKARYVVLFLRGHHNF